MGKAATALVFICLLLCSSLAFSARRTPAFTEEGERKKVDATIYGSSCAGVGEDECLFRRTLAAHTDYIYTQKQTP